MKLTVYMLIGVLLALTSFVLTAQEAESGFKTISIHKKPKEPIKEEVSAAFVSDFSDVKVISDIDKNIPKTVTKKAHRFAVIIGNEDYHSFQTSLGFEVDVNYAERDARLFRQYAINTLGIPEENILFEINANQIEMKRTFDKINLIMKNLSGEQEVFVYYAGHGFPDINSRTPYLIPVDVTANELEYAISLADIYQQLTEYPSKRVTVFLDACFSGGGRNLGLLAARSVKLKPKEEKAIGNLVVFTASSEEQSALPYKNQEHGMFTYYLLKKIQETGGDINYFELSEYLHQKVSIKSIMENNLEQTPKTIVSETLGDSWKDWTIK